MVNIILISHGAFCEGLLASLQMIAGGDYGVRAVPLIPRQNKEIAFSRTVSLRPRLLYHLFFLMYRIKKKFL